jgi:hypothetical protein
LTAAIRIEADKLAIQDRVLDRQLGQQGAEADEWFRFVDDLLPADQPGRARFDVCQSPEAVVLQFGDEFGIIERRFDPQRSDRSV